MKKILLLTTILGCTLLGSEQAKSLVVSDPGSYARMAQSLQTLKEQITVMKEQFTELQNINSAVTGNLKRGKGIFRDLGKLRDLSSKMTKSVHSLPHMDLDDYDLQNIEDLQDALDQIYVNETDVLKRGQTEQQRKQYQQRSIRSALEGAEVLISLQDERLNKIEELASEIDNTETLKDAMDLNNRLLGELLLVQQQALLINAQYIRAEQAVNYQYADKQSDGSDPNHKNREKTVLEKASEGFADKMDARSERLGHSLPSYMQ
jgi:hypothetical protein